MDHLNKLCSELRISRSEIKKTEEGGIFLPLNAKLSIAIRYLNPGFYLHAALAPCPKEKCEEVFTLLMKANFLCQGTFGATIGLSIDEKHLTLSSIFPYEMNYQTFRGMIEDFANMIDYWRSEIA